MIEVRRKVRKRKRKTTLKITLFVILSIIIFVGALSFSLIDKRLAPAIIEIANISSVSRINSVMDEALNDIINKYQLDSNDFYIRNQGEDGKTNYLSVNTLLINKVCSGLAADMSNKLKSQGAQDLSIPMGAMFGSGFFANMGPRIGFKVIPYGESVVDYSTSFTSAGINQINFQVWLNVESTVRIVNPLQNKDIVVTRKISLVNTIFSGEIPEIYVH